MPVQRNTTVGDDRRYVSRGDDSRNSLDPSKKSSYFDKFSGLETQLPVSYPQQVISVNNRDSRVTRDPYLDAYDISSNQYSNSGQQDNMRNSMTATSRNNLQFYEDANSSNHRYGSCYDKLSDPMLSSYPAQYSRWVLECKKQLTIGQIVRQFMQTSAGKINLSKLVNVSSLRLKRNFRSNKLFNVVCT